MVPPAGFFRHAKWIALCASACLLAAPSARAGFLDGLFGKPAPEPVYLPSAPLDTAPTLPKAAAKSAARAARHESESAGAVKARPAHLQDTIDSLSDPDWMLKDRTLRKGDIIVRADKVLVFQGAKGAPRPEDFVELSDSTAVSKGQREKVQKLTDAPRETAPTVRAAQATAEKPTASAEILAPAGGSEPLTSVLVAKSGG